MSSKTANHKVLKGHHVLAAICLFFSVIIGVNVTMAYLASSTWTGLVEKTHYDDARLKLRHEQKAAE